MKDIFRGRTTELKLSHSLTPPIIPLNNIFLVLSAVSRGSCSEPEVHLINLRRNSVIPIIVNPFSSLLSLIGLLITITF